MENIKTSIKQLKQDRDMIALELFSIDQGTKFLKELLPSILSSFSSTEALVDLPKIETMSKDQHKFFTLMKEVPYSEISDLTAYVPEGLVATYIHYLDILLPVTKKLKNLNGDVLQPYSLFLAKLMSDKNVAITTNSDKTNYAKMEHERDEIYKHFSKMFSHNSYKAESTVKYVIDRNSDWATVFHKVNECIVNMQAVDRELVKNQIAQCADYLKIIHSNLMEDGKSKASHEAAVRLSSGAYAVAKELELFSTTYYRVLTLNGSIENTVKYITKIVG